MSNIYIQEPPTSGKVLLKTTVGDIDIELWTKEAPKACRNFIQLCMENYYDGTIFHRVIKGFIAQGGDPTGTGTGGESVYGLPFKDEFHSRLRFVRRGLVATASSGKDDNTSQFFFTLGACPELQNKHTIFGKVTGKTLYNMLKLEESLVNNDDRPLYPHKIIETKVLSHPFSDIIPREKKKVTQEVEEKQKKPKATKNFNLLSFGEEAEEEEAEVDLVAQGFRGKSKSSHDLANDPRLSSTPAVAMTDEESNESIENNIKTKPENKAEVANTVETVRKKLQKDVAIKSTLVENTHVTDEKDDTGSIEDKRKEIQKEIRQLKRELKGKDKDADDTDVVESKQARKEVQSIGLKEHMKDLQKYKENKKKLPKSHGNRESMTLEMLEKFQKWMHSIREQKETDDNSFVDDNDSDENEDNGKWLMNSLHFDEKGPVLSKDASLKTEDTYEIFDPRNPINMRRREASKELLKKRL